MSAIAANTYIVTVEIEIISDSEQAARQDVLTAVNCLHSYDIVSGVGVVSSEVVAVIACGVMKD